MKLAEALIERAELQKLNKQLLSRIKDNILLQEGDSPAEDPEELITQYEECMGRLCELIQRINETNSKTLFENGLTIADAIALRDSIDARRTAYQNLYSAATITVSRYSKQEIKFVRSVDPKDLQTKINELAKAYRQLDTKLQGLNWTVELL